MIIAAHSEEYVNSPYSVQDINSGAVAWLRKDTRWEDDKNPDFIFAGATIEEFIDFVIRNDGEVYIKYRNTSV